MQTRLKILILDLLSLSFELFREEFLLALLSQLLIILALEDGMDAEFVFWPHSVAVWMNVHFEPLVPIDLMLVPDKTHLLSILNILNLDYTAHLASHDLWPINIEDLVVRLILNALVTGQGLISRIPGDLIKSFKLRRIRL